MEAATVTYSMFRRGCHLEEQYTVTATPRHDSQV